MTHVVVDCIILLPCPARHVQCISNTLSAIMPLRRVTTGTAANTSEVTRKRSDERVTGLACLISAYLSHRRATNSFISLQHLTLHHVP